MQVKSWEGPPNDLCLKLTHQKDLIDLLVGGFPLHYVTNKTIPRYVRID